jgi:hypothetical protein
LATKQNRSVSVLRCAAGCRFPIAASADKTLQLTGRLLDHVGDVSPGCEAAFCHRCKKVTEYRYLITLDMAS